MPLNSLGTYFTANSGFGTFVAQQAQITAFSDTGPLFVLNNTAQPGGKSIFLRRLKLFLGGTAPTGTISLHCGAQVDTVSKLPTAANQFTNPTPANADGRDGTLSVGELYAYTAAAALVTPASSASVRKLAYGRIPTGVAVVGDSYTFDFGLTEMPDSCTAGLTAARATSPAAMEEALGAVVVAPGQWCTLHLWWLTSATNLPTWSWELSWYEN